MSPAAVASTIGISETMPAEPSPKRSIRERLVGLAGSPPNAAISIDLAVQTFFSSNRREYYANDHRRWRYTHMSQTPSTRGYTYERRRPPCRHAKNYGHPLNLEIFYFKPISELDLSLASRLYYFAMDGCLEVYVLRIALSTHSR